MIIIDFNYRRESPLNGVRCWSRSFFSFLLSLSLSLSLLGFLEQKKPFFCVPRTRRSLLMHIDILARFNDPARGVEMQFPRCINISEELQLLIANCSTHITDFIHPTFIGHIPPFLGREHNWTIYFSILF